MLHNKTTTNDFNLPVGFSLFPYKGLANEYRANCPFSNHGSSSSPGFSQMRQAISGRPQNTKMLLRGSIPLYGIRSINLPREFTRHRSVPARQPVKAIPYGHSIQQASAFFVTRCKRNFQFKRRYSSHPMSRCRLKDLLRLPSSTAE